MHDESLNGNLSHIDHSTFNYIKIICNNNMAKPE